MVANQPVNHFRNWTPLNVRTHESILHSVLPLFHDPDLLVKLESQCRVKCSKSITACSSLRSSSSPNSLYPQRSIASLHDS